MASIEDSGRKKRKISSSTDAKINFFKELPADLALDIVSKLGATASCPADFINLLLTCKRMNKLGMHPTVLSTVSPKVFTCTVRNWEQNNINFMRSCARAGNLDAIYTVGMITFYCYEGKNREYGKTLIERAAVKFHPEAIYAISIMMFNGSGGARKYPEGGVDLLKQAALLGHIEATYELGHCLEDDYGVERDVGEGRKLILQAIARGIATSLGLLPSCTMECGAEPNRILLPVPKMPSLAKGEWVRWLPKSRPGRVTESTDKFPWNVREPERHPVRRFLIESFACRGEVAGEGRRLCNSRRCGLPETCGREFRRCFGCGTVSYCSLLCQKTDWVRRHRMECTVTPLDQDEEGGIDGNDSDGDGDSEENEEEEVGSGGDLEDKEEQIQRIFTFGSLFCMHKLYISFSVEIFVKIC